MCNCCGGLLLHLVRQINVELIITLTTFSHFLTDDLVEAQILDYSTQQWSSDPSTNNTTEDSISSTQQLILFSDRLVLLNQLLAILPGAVMCLVLAPAGDRHGRRRIFILLPLLGRAGTLMALTFHLPSVMTLTLSSLGEGLGGGVCLLTVGLYAVLRDTTANNRITGRVGVTLGLFTASGLLGTLTRSQMLIKYDPGVVYMTSFSTIVLASILALAAITEGPAVPAASLAGSDVSRLPDSLRAYRVLFFDNKRQVALYLLCAFAFQLGQSGQSHITVFYNGLELNFFGTFFPFSVTMEKIVSIFGFLVVVPLATGRYKSWMDDDFMGMAGNVGMVVLCVTKALFTDGLVWAAFGVSFLMLVGCLASVAALSSVINSVTSQEIGAAMAAQTVLTMMATLVGNPAADAILLNKSSDGFGGSVLLFTAGVHFLAFLFYALANRKRNQVTDHRVAGIRQPFDSQQQLFGTNLAASIGVF